MSGNKFTSVVLATMLLLSVFAGGFVGSVAASDHYKDGADKTVTDGGLYWQGQTLSYSDANVSANETVVMRKVTDDGTEFVGEYKANSSGVLVFETDNFQGEYEMEDENGTALASFEVASQSLDVSVDNETVYNKDDVSQNSATFELDSNRASYNVVVDAEGLTIEELEEVFNGTNYTVANDTDGNEYFYITVDSNSDEIEGNFSAQSTGDYTLDFTVEDTGVTASQDVTVADPGDKNAQFDDTVYTEVVGDVVEITVDLDNTDSAEVTFGGNASNYESTVSISDADDDSVTLLFDTTEAGDTDDSESPWSLHEDSDATLTDDLANESNLSDALDAYNYDLSVSVDGFEKDVATVNLEERNTEGVNIWTLPDSSEAELDDIQQNATQTDAVAAGDYVIVQVEASGVYANLDNDTTGADLENGSAFAEEYGIEMALVDEDPGKNQGPKEFDISSGDVIVDEENDTFFLVLDTANLNNEDGDMPTAYFNMTENNSYISDEEEAEEQSASTQFEFVDREFEYNNLNDDEVVEVTAEEEAFVGGETTAAPGTEVSITLRSEAGAETPFLLSDTTMVQEDGTVGASFDMSGFEAGTNFTVSVSKLAPDRQDATLESAGPSEYNVSVTVVDADGEPVENASVDVGGASAQTDADGVATVAVLEGSQSVMVDADGYFANEDTVNVSENNTEFEYTLEAQPVEYEVSMMVVDQDGEPVEGATVMVDGSSYTSDADGMVSVVLEEGDYEASASADGYEGASQSVTVDSDAEVTLELTAEQTETPTPTEDDNTTPTDDGNDSSDGGDGDDNGTETPGQPGFGIAVALIALAGAALLAVRRN